METDTASASLPLYSHQISWWAVDLEAMKVIAQHVDSLRPVADASALAAAAAATPDEPTGGVAVLRLSGLITPKPSLLSLLMGGGGGLQAFRSQLRSAVASEEVGSILLDIDSPGGSTDLITETASEIRAARSKKPIVALANPTAGSAAYWLGSQANEFAVTPSGAAGSIGVFAMHLDRSAEAEQAGVKVSYVSAGKFKTEGNQFEPLSDDARSAAQQVVDDHYGLFVRDVAKGRGVGVDDVRGGFGEGRVLTAKRAVEAGMADRVDTFEATVARMVKGDLPSTTRAEAPALIEEPQAFVPSPDDKPELKANAEEAKARIGRVLAAQPFHTDKE